MNKRKTIVIACVLFVGGYMVGDRNGKQKKVNEIKQTMTDLQMDWYHWQDVESIIEDEILNPLNPDGESKVKTE